MVTSMNSTSTRKSPRITEKITKQTKMSKRQVVIQKLADLVSCAKDAFIAEGLSTAVLLKLSDTSEFNSRVLAKLTLNEQKQILNTYSSTVWENVVMIYYNHYGKHEAILEEMMAKVDINRKLYPTDFYKCQDKFFNAMGEDKFNELKLHICKEKITSFVFFRIISYTSFRKHFLKVFNEKKWANIRKQFYDNFLDIMAVRYYAYKN